MPKYRNDVNKEQLIRKYLDGESISSLSKTFNVSRKTISRWLKKENVPYRGIKEANELHLSTLSKQDLKAKTKAANQAVRSKKKGKETLTKRALYYENNPDMRQSRYERMFNKYLLANSVDFKPQKSIERYNIDFAFPEKKIALEIFGGVWHGQERKVKAFNRKSQLLFDKGWSVVVVWCRGDLAPGELLDYIENINDQEPRHHVLTGLVKKSKIGAKKINYRL